MTEQVQFIDKELSWLSFNERVLQEAADPSVPPIERVRFLGIYSSNLDEFFQVRVAEVRRRVLIGQTHGDAEEAEALLARIQDKVAKLTKRFSEVSEEVFTALERHHIHVMMDTQALTAFQISWIKSFFHRQVMRYMSPVILSKQIDLASTLEVDNSHLLVALHHQDDVTYALIEVPSDRISRFTLLPPEGSRKEKYIVLLDDIITHCIDDVFKPFFSYDRLEVFSFKMTRDAEYNLDDELDQSLLDKMSRGLKQRLSAEPVRLVYDENMPEHMVRLLKRRLKLKDMDRLSC